MIKTNSVLVATCLLLCTSLFADADKIQEINAPVSSVKVCLNSALITHTQKIKIKSGVNKYAFLGIAGNINSKSVEIRNLGTTELLSLKVLSLSDVTDVSLLEEDFLNLFGKSKDSILIIEKRLESLNFDVAALELEKNMLLKNDDIIPNSKTITLSELKITTEYYRERYKDICIAISNKKKELTKTYKLKNNIFKSVFNIENQLDNDYGYSVVIAEIDNKSVDINTDIQLSYVAFGSGWIPVYEIYANNNKALKINYRAKVLNNTGLDWNKMNIVISTSDPNEYYSAPDVEPFYVGKSRYSKGLKYDYNSSNTQQSKKKETNDNEEEIYTPEREISFFIQKKYDFKTGKVPTYIDVTNYDLTPQFLYRCAPKKEEQVYSIAKIKDWEKLNLIDGEATIYNNSSYLGKTYIKPSEIDEELELPLGVVDNIFIKHKLVNEYSSKKMLGTSIVANYNYEIKIKNGSTENIAVEVIDQIPVSETSSVKTDVIEITEGNDLESETGKILWKLDLTASSEKTLVLKYSVNYPRGYSIFKTYKKRKTRSKF